MKKYLVGYTGFVGSNLTLQEKFDKLFNSQNISEAFGTKPDLLVYAGVPAQKFLANTNPAQDLEIINNAIENIKKIQPKKIILISTIDVYDKPNLVDEDTTNYMEIEAYGKNRRILEKWVQDNFEDYLIVRLPALYGKNIKKNFIYDLINYIPSMLKEEKYLELTKKNPNLKNYYIKQENGFYKCKNLNFLEKKDLKQILTNLNFSALNFTDSRATFQFYNLKFLWNDIQICLNHNLKVVNLATEPISANELYKYIFNVPFKNEFAENIPYYNFKTKYDNYFSKNNGYILSKDFILEDIKKFIEKQMNNRICISNIAWEDSDDEEIYNFLKNKGVKYIEIAPTRLAGENPYDKILLAKEKALELKEKYDLEIVSMQSIWYGKDKNIFENDTNRKDLLEYTKKAINFASAIGCSNIVFGNPKNRNMLDYEKNYLEAIKFFRDLGDYAFQKKVVLAIEPNPVIYKTNFLNRTDETIEFVKKVDRQNIKVNYDLGTVIFNQESLDILKNNLNYINHIHISEPNLVPIEKREIHKELFEILNTNNYRNIVSIEMKKCDIEKTKEIINYMSDLW